jgi:uncharacterized protein (DUF1810 family)
MDPYNLSRFVQAQEQTYDQALSEFNLGRKQSHGMWYVFPQLDGLSSSPITKLYSIKSEDEARAYLKNATLGPRLLECAEAILSVDGKPAREILGSPDDLKLKSCATLFAHASPPESVLERILERFYSVSLRRGETGPRQVRGPVLHKWPVANRCKSRRFDQLTQFSEVVAHTAFEQLSDEHVHVAQWTGQPIPGNLAFEPESRLIGRRLQCVAISKRSGARQALDGEELIGHILGDRDLVLDGAARQRPPDLVTRAEGRRAGREWDNFFHGLIPSRHRVNVGQNSEHVVWLTADIYIDAERSHQTLRRLDNRKK